MGSHSTVGIDSLQMQEHENGLGGQDIVPVSDHSLVIYPLAAHRPFSPCRLSPGSRHDERLDRDARPSKSIGSLRADVFASFDRLLR